MQVMSSSSDVRREAAVHISEMSAAPTLTTDEMEAALNGSSDAELVMVDEDECGLTQEDMYFLWFSSKTPKTNEHVKNLHGVTPKTDTPTRIEQRFRRTLSVPDHTITSHRPRSD